MKKQKFASISKIKKEDKVIDYDEENVDTNITRKMFEKEYKERRKKK